MTKMYKKLVHDSQKIKITKRDISAALHTSLPIMVTFIVLGAGFGILMQEHGYGPVWSLLSGIIIFSGTVQFVSVTMLGSGSYIMAAITALMVAARHIFFSISMIGRYKNEGNRKWYLYYALCDETYAMLSRDDMISGVNTSAYRLLVTFLDQVSWILGSVLGGLLDSLLDFILINEMHCHFVNELAPGACRFAADFFLRPDASQLYR